MSLKVFYDGKCGLCSKEISYYQKIAIKDVFNWIDLNKMSPSDLREEEISLCDGLKLLHAKDENGFMHLGVDAFIKIWERLNYWRILAKFVSLPIIKNISNFLYLYFANWRFNRLDHCRILVKNSKKTR